MIAYVETNFLLELALLQEQHAACESILQLTERGQLRLAVPAYCLVEPHETLGRRHRDRQQIKARLDQELRQLARTATLQPLLADFQDVTSLLIASAYEEQRLLETVRARLLSSAEIIPTTDAVLIKAREYQESLELGPQDAIVYASVLEHLGRSALPQSCFLEKDGADFANPLIRETLAGHGCTLIFDFNDGLGFLSARLPPGVVGRSGVGAPPPQG